eukprot:gene11047-3755_t
MDEIFKIIVVGDSKVGKTSITTRFVQNKFPTEEYLKSTTSNSQFLIKTHEMNNKKYELHIYDTNYSNEIKQISESILSNSKGILICFDQSNIESYKSIIGWLSEIASFFPECSIILVANKMDKTTKEKKVGIQKAKSFAEKNSLKLFETSALQDINILETFEELIKSKPRRLERTITFKKELSTNENMRKLSRVFLEVEGQPKYLKYMNEDVSTLSWRQHKKHIFILTEAGKPIFSRYGKEDDLSPLMGMLMAVVSFIEDDGDSIRTIYTGGEHKIIFVVKGPVYFVCVSCTNETENELKNQLELLYTQIIFILTERIIDHLKKKSSFDLRNLLGGTDNVLHSLIHAMSCDMSFTFNSFKTLKLTKQIRNSIGDILIKNVPDKTLFSILIADNKIVHLGRLKKYSLQPLDLLLLLNFINSSKSIRTSETWTPLCLPGFSPEGFLYAYIHFPKNDICLILINLSQNNFFECSTFKSNLEEKFNQLKLFSKIKDGMEYEGINPKDIGLPEVRQFIYKLNDQFISSNFISPYNSKNEKKRLIRLYKLIRDKLLKQPNLTSSNIKQFFLTNEKESIFVSISGNEELYVAFPLTTSKNVAIESCELIKKFIQKEDSFFISNQIQW